MTPDIGRHGTSGNSMPDNNNQLKYENDRLKIALAQRSVAISCLSVCLVGDNEVN